MNDWVVDANVIVKWILPEPDSALAFQVAADTTAAGGTLHTLDLAVIEATHVIWTKLHRRLLTLAEAHQALALLQLINVQINESLPLLTKAFDVAAQFDVAVYDALFVVSVRERAVNGVTADEPLVRAVGAAYPEIKLLRNW